MKNTLKQNEEHSQIKKKKKKIVIELAHKKPNINPKRKANPI